MRIKLIKLKQIVITDIITWEWKVIIILAKA